MPTLSKEQYDTLKARGLTDENIQLLAKKKGYEMPDTRDLLAKSSDIVGKIFPGKKVGESIGTLAGYALSKNKEFYDTSAPTPLQVAGDVVAGATTIAGLKAPIPATTLGRIGQTATLGGTLSSSQAVAEGKDVGQVVNEGVKGAVTGAVVQGVFEAVPAVIKLFGTKSSEASKALREKNLRLSPLQKEKLNSKVDDVVNYLSANKAKGNPQQQYKFISDKYDGIENQVQKVLKTSGKNYSKQEILDAIDEIPTNYATEFDNPEVYDQLIKKTDKLKEYLNKNFGDSIPSTKLNQFKRSYMKNGYNKAGDAISNEASLAIGDSLYTKLLSDIPQLQTLNKEYQTILIGKKILGKALGRNELGLIGNLVSSAGGAIVGGAIGGPVGSATGTIIGPKVGKIVGGTAARTQYARALEQLSKIAQKSSGKSNVTIPRTLLISIINSNQ